MWNNNNDYKIVMRKYYMLGNIRSQYDCMISCMFIFFITVNHNQNIKY